MRIIVIESTVFKVTEKQFRELRAMEKQIHKNGYHSDNDIKVSDWFEKHTKDYKKIGNIEYDFRL